MVTNYGYGHLSDKGLTPAEIRARAFIRLRVFNMSNDWFPVILHITL